MTLFGQYAKPDVYSQKIANDDSVNLFGDATLGVIIGEGQEEFTGLTVELHRGSSSQVDDLVAEENLSGQIDGITRSFKLSHYPVVSGDGTGTLSTNPEDITILVNDVRMTVSDLNAATGDFLIDSIPAQGSVMSARYYIKKQDTLITEDISNQIPVFATYNAQPGMTISLSQPGALGNNVTLAFTTAATGSGVSDDLAVSGIGTDTISIELRKTTNAIRTRDEVKALILPGITTASSGILTVPTTVASGSTAAISVPATAFSGGMGQSTNTTFKLSSPVMDGSNGGVISNWTSAVTMTLNGNPVVVNAVDGLNRLVTLATGVTSGTLVAEYYTNTMQDTSDTIPAANVTGVTSVGYAQGRTDFIEGVDFVFDGKGIVWGNATKIVAGNAVSGYTPFDATAITTTMVDENVYLRPLSGVTNGTNREFTLEDVPTDGSGKSTDDVTLIKVYVGDAVNSAKQGGAVTVARLYGDTRKVVLQNPPATGKKVYGTYHRNLATDETYTLKPAVIGSKGFGSYTIVNETGHQAPVVTEGVHTVADSAKFAALGLVWPNSFSDLRATIGASVNETVTVTFTSTNGTDVTVPAVQASNNVGVVSSVPGTNYLHLVASIPGVVGNSVSVTVDVATPTADNAAIVVVGSAITVYAQKIGGVIRTLDEVAAYFNSVAGVVTAAGGRIVATVMGSGTSNVVTHVSSSFTGGVDATTIAHAREFNVTSSLGSLGSAGSGVVGQTYTDVKTGLTFTLVDPFDANLVDYGYTSGISNGYKFAAGDTLVFVVSNSTAIKTSDIPAIQIPSVRLLVTNTIGMNLNNTALVTVYSKNGNEPKIGEFYYVTYKQAKPDSEFGLKFFTDLTKVYAAYGSPNTKNRLSLGAKIAALNGASIIGCYQVKKQTGSERASDSAFIDAISALGRVVPGTDRKVDLITPMSTSAAVAQALSKHIIIQSSARKKGEAQGFVGTGLGVTHNSVKSLARSLRNESMVLVYTGGQIIEIEENGKTAQFAVGGEFAACGLAGLRMSPAVDEATTLTTMKVNGFVRAIDESDEDTYDLLASEGVTILYNMDSALEVRHYISTDPRTPLTREPTNASIGARVAKTMRKVFKPFISRKSKKSIANDLTIVGQAALRNLMDNEIIEGFKNMTVTRDENDPAVFHVKFAYMPMFSVLWISVEFSVTVRLA